MRISKDIIQTILLALVIYLVLQSTMQTRLVLGASMEPSLQSGERVWVSKIVYRRISWLSSLRSEGYLFHRPHRGDVVIFHPYLTSPEDYIKRVIGLPGEVIEVKGGTVYINGRPLEEPYIENRPAYSLPPTTIPADHYFLLGDNRNASVDSHNLQTIGPVPFKNFIGKAWFSYWPPKSWGGVPNHSFSF